MQSNPQVYMQPYIQQNIQHNIQPNIQQNIQPNIQQNIQPNMSPNMQPNMSPNMQSISQANMQQFIPQNGSMVSLPKVPFISNQPVKLTKKMKQKKGEYRKNLESDNARLKAEILELQQQVLIKEAENRTLKTQLTFFQSVNLNEKV